MSRHRDIRSMNYSDEYDGYDDVYGHSVEDDYCVSPGAEQFLYDRNKQQNIASFINEPDIKEDDEECAEDSTASSKKSQLSELDSAKLVSCIEVIRDVIGDTIPDAVVTKKIIEFNFDTEAALNDILQSTTSQHQSAASNIINKERAESQTGSSTKIHKNSNFSLQSTGSLFDKTSSSSMHNSENLKQISNKGFSSLSQLMTNYKSTNSVTVTEKPKFNSLAQLMNKRTNNVCQLKRQENCDPPIMEVDQKPFNSLEAITAHHLQKSCDSLGKTVESKVAFIIPKLSKKSSNNSPITFITKSEQNITEEISVDAVNSSEISQLSNNSEELEKNKTDNDDWVIDLTMALRRTGIQSINQNKNSKSINNELKSSDKVMNTKLVENFYDMKDLHQCITDAVPYSLIEKSFNILECNLSLKKLCDIKMKYKSKTASRFGKMLCRKWKIPKSNFVKTIFEPEFVGNLKRFDFATPSPDTRILLNLQRMKAKIKPLVQVITPKSAKVIPATTKSIVKGFNLSGFENNELLYPRQESPRSQSPSSEINSPNLWRKNDTTPRKNLNASTSNTPRCQSPMSGRATPEYDSKMKNVVEDKRDAMAIYKKKRLESKDQLHLVVVGHVDAGKSTLLGRLLCDLGQISSRLIHKYQQESKKVGKQSFAYAWVLDETGEERERGITMDIGYSKFETETKSITLLDAPGHKDFIPNMITGATQADVALLVVDATRGEFETGFDSGGQTREHALLLRSLGVSQIAVVVNKLDTVDWSKDRFNEIVDKMSVFLKQVGFRDNVPFVPCSGLSGENIVEPSKAEGLSSWYTGPTLLSVIDSFKCPERPVTKPFRFSVNDIFKGTGSGFCVSGHVETGMVAVGDKVLLLPDNEIVVVKGITVDEIPTQNGFAGDHISLTISGIDQQKVGIGDIICSPQKPIPVTTCFQAHVVIFAIAMPITKGLPIVLHVQSLVEPAVITKLIDQLNKSTGEVIKHKPRCLPKNTSAIIEITTQRSICLELYKDIKQLGRVMLRVSGTTIAAGLVTKIK